jgi:hypothetical protein
MAFMLSCNFITGLGTGSSNEFSVDLDSPADPVNVTVELNEDETTSSVISPEGGELTITSADGSVYTLEVPAGALLADTEISMTTIGSMEGGPVESNVYGVQLEPSGMAFYEFLTLTIQPAAEIPLEEQFMFKYERNGDDLHHAMVDPNTQEIRIKLLSFSGAGVGHVTKVSENLGKLRDAQLRVDNAYGKLFQEARKSTTPAQKAAMVNVIESLLNVQSTLVDALIAAAKEDCQNLEQALEAKRILDKYTKELYSSDLIQDPSGGGGVDDDLAPVNDYRKDELNQLKEKCQRAYNIQGPSGAFQIDHNVCNIYGPFTLLAKGPDGCVSSESFTPIAGSLSGQYHFSVSGCPRDISGKGDGTYKIELSPGGGKLTATYISDFLGKSESITSFFKLKPLKPGEPCK